MFGIDEGGYTSCLLRFGNGMNRQGCLTRTFGTVDFDNASARITSYAQGEIKRDAARRNHFDLLHLLVTQFHDGALTETLLYFFHGHLKRFQLLLLLFAGQYFFLCHIDNSCLYA